MHDIGDAKLLIFGSSPTVSEIVIVVMLASQNEGPQYRPKNSLVLVMGTPKKGTPNLGKPPCI